MEKKMNVRTNVYLLLLVAVLCVTTQVQSQDDNQSELSQKIQEKYCPAPNE